MKLSVIIPIYNVEQYIEECFESLKKQAFKDIEYILIDDGSKDKSAEICDRYARQDARFRVFHVVNGGVSKARNLGIEALSADSDYVTFVDPDDYISNADYYEQVLHEIQRCDNPDLMFVTYTEDVEGKKRKVNFPSRFLNSALNFNEIYQAAVYGTRNTASEMINCSLYGKFVKTSIIRKKKLLFDVTLRQAEDWLYVSTLLRYTPKVALYDIADYHYRIRPGSIMTSRKKPVNTLGIEKAYYIVNSIYQNAMLTPQVKQEEIKRIAAVQFCQTRINVYRNLVQTMPSLKDAYRTACNLLNFKNIPIIADIDNQLQAVSVTHVMGVRKKIDCFIAKSRNHLLGIIYAFIIEKIK